MAINYKLNDEIINNLVTFLQNMRQLNQQHEAGKGRVVDVDIDYTTDQLQAIVGRYFELKAEFDVEYAKLP